MSIHPRSLEVLVQELTFIAAESDSASLILRATDSDGEFFLPVSEDLRSFILDATASSPAPSATISPASESNPQLEAVETTEEDPATEPAVAPVVTSTPAPERSRKLSLPPREIQDRIRRGASVREIAEETGTEESRIEPYAWPILQERARIAELARTTHPVSQAGTSELTLWEVLATALAARGENLGNSEWDAHQNSSRKWIVTVTWEKPVAGQTSLHAAEFQLQLEPTGPSLAHPHNSIAGDLVDPRYGQPVRHVAPVSPLSVVPEEVDVEEGEPVGVEDEVTTEDGDTDEFLLHPKQEDRTRRKRKAVTPHWEDVLLGVRTNPKKKK